MNKKDLILTEIDDSEWRNSPLWQLYASTVYPLMKRGKKNEIEETTAIRFAAEIRSRPEEIISLFHKYESALVKENATPTIGPDEKAPVFSYL